MDSMVYRPGGRRRNASGRCVPSHLITRRLIGILEAERETLGIASHPTRDAYCFSSSARQLSFRVPRKEVKALIVGDYYFPVPPRTEKESREQFPTSATEPRRQHDPLKSLSTLPSSHSRLPPRRHPSGQRDDRSLPMDPNVRPRPQAQHRRRAGQGLPSSALSFRGVGPRRDRRTRSPPGCRRPGTRPPVPRAPPGPGCAASGGRSWG